MFNRAELKRSVRETIKGKWLSIFFTSLLVGLVIMIPFGIIYGITVTPIITSSIQMLDTPDISLSMLVPLFISIVYVILVGAPLGTSLCGYFVKISRREPTDMAEAFSGFKNFKPFVLSYLWIMLWSLLWLMPYIALYTVGTVLIMAESYGIGVILLILSIAAYIFAIVKILGYSMATYIIWEDPNLGAKGALDLSKQMMQGHKSEFFVFSLSFLPWYLLVSITCGIASIYVDPYVSVASAAYYDYLRTNTLSTEII